MSFLDHFIGKNPHTEELRLSICRNLEMMLESRRVFMAGDLSESLQTSLYGYGLENLHRCRSAVETSAICRDLEQLIRRFEPRLMDVVVELDRTDEQKNALRFSIEASLIGQGGAREVFDTTINLTNSTLDIKGYQT